ncbi:hypothetical protein HXA31_20415 [Salipaludibacillus agaradhaerens]|uniref:Uncharacterized protein n=1 Tax=Salipaludibacillus agaradhaerens TaxID=76935 RepID=A0A9Q4B2L9_SALAG|nr:hypothetical protein [Salipaludibacillus agaradhaerens]MCR6096852.1 hypothetical protein [Salipaludibacillus agaradhaerens]MCR6116696.1 hypothetical protein [Salipaludibacillus agaradhaerens]
MKLKLQHAFKVSRILKKMKIRPDIKAKMKQEELGLHMMLEAFENIGNAEQEVYEFIGELKGVEASEVAEWDFDQFIEFIDEFKKIEGLDRFFTSVSKLMK